MIRCQSCGKELPDGSKFCDACGSLVSEASANNTYADNNAYTGNVTGGNTGAMSDNMKKYLKLGGIAVAAIVLLIVIISIIASGGEPKSNHVIYAKDGELWFSNLNKMKPFEVSNDFVAGSDESIQVSGEADIIAYIEDVDDNVLYWRETKKSDSEAVKVKDDVTGFTLTEDGKYIIVQTNDGGIYEYDVKKREDIKVNKEASRSTVGETGFVYYESKTEEKTKTNDDGEEYKTEVELRTYYLKKFGNDEPIKLADKIDGFLRCVDADKMKEFYYTDDEALYKLDKPGKEAEKIESDVTSMVKAFNNGDLYFTKTEEHEEEADNNILYYYNGKESVKVVDYYDDYVDYAIDKNVLVIETCNPDDVGEDESREDAVKAALVVNGVFCDLGKDDACGFIVSEDGSTVYYLADISRDGETDEFNSANLYKVSVGKDSIKSNEKFASDVSDEYYVLDAESGKKVAYFKDWDDDENYGTLFVNDKQIDTEVHDIAAIHAFSTDFLYEKDYKDGSCTLMICDNAKNGEKIDDDVYRAAFTDEGDVIFLSDYDTEDGEGTLNVFDGKVEEIDTEVNGFLPDYSASGGLYGRF